MDRDTVRVDEPDVTESVEPALPADGDDVLVEDLLVEEVSIDGMCGVY